MEPHVAVSMRSAQGTARQIMQEVTDCGTKTIQLDALHPDFHGLSISGRRDLAATIRRFGLRASGVDLLIPSTVWDSSPDQTLQAFADAVAIAESVGNVPVGTLLPDNNELCQSAIAIGQRCGVLVSTHGVMPPSDPMVGWHLPITLLAKEDRPMKSLAQASHGPMAIRLKGSIVDDHGVSIEVEGSQFDLRELRGVLDAMQWEPTPIIDAALEDAIKLLKAWQVAGPW